MFEIKLFFILVLLVVFLNIVSSETTFFESSYGVNYFIDGETNLNESSFICGNAVCDLDEDCSNCKRDCGLCVFEGYSPSLEEEVFVEYFDEGFFCEIARKFILDGGNNESIDYYLSEINENRSVDISRSKFLFYVNNFNEVCLLKLKTTPSVEKYSFKNNYFVYIASFILVSFVIYVIFRNRIKKRRKL